MEQDKAVIFVETGRRPVPTDDAWFDENGKLNTGTVGATHDRCACIGARRIDLSIGAAVERVKAVIERAVDAKMMPWDETIRAAILGSQEPEQPLAWEIEAARKWEEPHGPFSTSEERVQALARHFAAARRAQTGEGK